MARNKVRELVIAQLLAGKAQADVAKSMGIPIGTIKSHWRLYKQRGTTDDAPITGRPKTSRTEATINATREAIEENPNTSIRRLGRELEVPKSTMERVVKKDLALKSLAVVRCQQLTPAQRDGRRSMGTTILAKLKNEAAGKILVFSDEKDFHVDKHINRRNERTIATSAKAVDPSNRFVGRSKFPQKAMLFAFVGSDGTAFPPVWIDGTLDAAKYKSILIRKVFPLLDATYGRGNYIWTQDGASAHTANIVLRYLESKLGSRGFWSKGIWPANSYNLNPLDYSIWNYVESRACASAHSSVDSLKAAINREWEAMPTSFVASACKAFRRRVEAMLAAEGGGFEKD